MKKIAKRIASIFISIILISMSLLNPIVLAASDVYELTFDNLFVFEQWANHAKSGIISPNLTNAEITKDISAGSFTLTNNSTDEIFTAFSMSSNTGYYSMPVKPSTTYIFKYNANGTVTSFESFVFYFDSSDAYISFDTAMATQYGDNQWTFTTPENAAFIQVRFDNNTPGSYATVKDIRICESAVYEYSKDITFRTVYTYSQGNTYGELPTPNRSGLVFAGWYTGPDGTGERITENTLIAATSYSLYSKWETQLDGTISVASLPTKQTYCLGEKLNASGLSININHSNGTTETLNSGFYYYPQILDTLGQQTITIEYGGKQTSFTVTVKESENVSVTVNNSTITASVANYNYTINQTASAFNRYEVHYSSDAYVKAVMLMGSTQEEFFLEPAEDGVFTGYIDGFLDGTTQTQISSISFTALDKEFMDFTLDSVTTTSDTIPDTLVYLSSADYKIGINLSWGGALSYLEDLTNSVYSSVSKYSSSKITEVDFKSKVSTSSFLYNTSSSVNLINCNDTGRLVQQSYYGTGSPPYELGDYNGTPWNYNPVQGGNVHNEPSKIVDLKVTENEIYVKCRPLDWGKTMEHITPSYMEAWYTLEDGLMRTTCRFVDYSGYPEATTTQELPAFYCVEPLNNFVYYAGGEPWSDSNTRVDEKSLQFWGDHPEQTFYSNENWCAFIGDDADSFGIGLYSPGQTNMYSGVFNRDTSTTVSPATESATSYIAPVDTFTFKSFSPYSYAFYITTGNVDTIRSTFKEVATDIDDPCKVGYTNGYCNVCGKNESATLTTDKYDLNGDGTMDSVYEISNAGQLHWFSDFVNIGNSTANAVLTNDITDNSPVLTSYGILNSDTSKFKIWTPIGNSSTQYKGIFDGQCHTISGLYTDSDTATYVGLFGYTSSAATVKKVGIDDSYFGGSTYVGGIAGQNDGVIENCYTYCIVADGTSYVGGITGKTTNTIKNCYNMGVVDSSDNYCGAITGYSSLQANLSNCFYLSDCAKDGSGTSQYGRGNATKGSTTADATNYSDSKTLEEFASGEVAWSLQAAIAEQIWGQKTNIEGAGPVFDTTGEYKVISSLNYDGGYSLIYIGDVIDDDYLNVLDFQQLVNTALSEKEITEKEMFLSDMNGDSVLNVIDCSMLERLIYGHNVDIPVYLKGDFDLDGVAFTAYDISLMKTAFKNISELTLQQKYICDINSDDVVDSKDLELLNQQTPSSTTPVYTTIKDAMNLKTKTANVIILCGQSNAYGASPLTDAVKTMVGNTDFSNIKIKYNNINSTDGSSGWKTYYSNEEFETFKLGIGGQADLWFGPEVGLSWFLATSEDTKDEMWYIIKYTGAGTFLGGNWIYDTNYNNAVTAENLYNDLGGYLSDLMVDYVNDSLDDIVKMHGANNINIRSFLWHQGESDSGFEQWANQYGDLQNILVNKVRTNFETRDIDSHIGFVDGGIAAYDSRTFLNPLTNAEQTYNNWVYSDTVNTHKSTNATLWYVPADTTGNVINMTTAGLYANSAPTSTTLANSIWIDTSTCLSKYVNNNENGEYDGAHYCGDSMWRMGIWYAQGMLQVANYY